MAHSIQRLTIFALISALELDLREFIQLYLVPVVGETSLIGSDLTKKCTDRFQRDNPNETPDLDDLVDYLDFWR
jgi:LuxR family transcriptional regulator, glucitol operon activator